MNTMTKVASGCLTAVLLGIVTVLAIILAIVGLVTAPLAGILSLGGGAVAAPSNLAAADIPSAYLPLYQQAATTCPGLPWQVLAAVGKIESDHGRDPTMVSSAGALGPMQFLPTTWNLYGQGGSIWNPADAIGAAARYLCATGARDGRDIRGALYAYNPDGRYVDQVMDQAAKYASSPATSGTGSSSTAAAVAIDYARAQIGTPYLWGGDGPAEGGFDCSGLTKAAYAAAGITIPRVAQDQYEAGPRVPPGAPLLPGDLVFYGTASNIHHVGLYVGEGFMIDAPKPGALVRLERMRYPGDDYYGATRPAERD